MCEYTNVPIQMYVIGTLVHFDAANISNDYANSNWKIICGGIFFSLRRENVQ